MLVNGKSIVMLLGGLIVAATLAILYAPTIGQAKETTGKSADSADGSDSESEVATKHNLKQLVLALQSYHDTHKVLPAYATVNATGKPLLSWRVQILPFVGEGELYKEFHLDEPWDSEHNRRFVDRMPAVFKNSKLDRPGMTNYLAVVGEECVFLPAAKGIGFVSISD